MMMQLALREMQSLLGKRQLWIAFSVVVTLFVFTGPFGTFGALGFAERLGYWLTVHAITWLIALAGISLVKAARGQAEHISLIDTVAGCCLASPLIGGAVSAINAAFLGLAVTPSGLLWQTLQVLPVAVAVGLVAYFFFQPAGRAAASAAEAASRPSGNRLMLRLPPEKRGSLQHLTMQDHYVEVVTDKGQELVLLRLGDAIAEVGDGQGIRIHRSHWVAFDAIRSVERVQGKVFVVSNGNTRLPVSRTYIPALKQAGLL
jgi:DNA-binding LytR/AlgR family response regulator